MEGTCLDVLAASVAVTAYALLQGRSSGQPSTAKPRLATIYIEAFPLPIPTWHFFPLQPNINTEKHKTVISTISTSHGRSFHQLHLAATWRSSSDAGRDSRTTEERLEEYEERRLLFMGVV